MAYKVSREEFAEHVEAALDELPEEFARFLEEVPVEVRDRPSRAQLRAGRVAKDHILLGLYQGRPRTVRSVEDSGTMPDVIYIFQEPIEHISSDAQQLESQIRKTVLHEIGHHFGLSEDDLERLGYR
jgi:predicted Zn-dependent protease with MMP-like domain